jgi:hypothetical protein
MNLKPRIVSREYKKGITKAITKKPISRVDVILSDFRQLFHDSDFNKQTLGKKYSLLADHFSTDSQKSIYYVKLAFRQLIKENNISSAFHIAMKWRGLKKGDKEYLWAALKPWLEKDIAKSKRLILQETRFRDNLISSLMTQYSNYARAMDLGNLSAYSDMVYDFIGELRKQLE